MLPLMYLSVPQKQHIRVLITFGAWCAILYMFWRIGDPFPILSPKHGEFKEHVPLWYNQTLRFSGAKTAPKVYFNIHKWQLMRLHVESGAQSP